MLTALELTGFKSFAEKTRFDFPDGITVIVGPNGSGKSNVVDAIKWVLGAQSAKSLRGKDMIDVIFKGSSSAGRKPSNSAEATLVFDNEEKKLAVDSDEVHVTRRVYRSGEGEYLINGQACRLKDIKNLFRGTGVGVDAYSLIEQGKVDRMLQASPRDRRIIFEEAAGISRFNAKKAEAARRLERVDQNLTRLKDIVDEVHTRLSRLKSQASKAQRYREMTARLHELRLRLGWTEYSTLNDKTEKIESRIQQLEAEFTIKQTEQEESRTAAQQAELELHKVAQDCQSVEERLQEALQQIAVCQNQQESLRARITETEEEEARQAARLATLRSRAGSVQQEHESIAKDLASVQASFDTSRQRADAAGKKADKIRDEIAERRKAAAELRTVHARFQQESAELNAQVKDRKKRLEDLVQAIQSTREKLAENEKARESATRVADKAKEQLADARNRFDATTQKLNQTKAQFAEQQTRISELQEQSALITGRLSGASERLEILEQLQQHLDGVDAGARYVLDLASKSEDPALKSIHGLVAELLKVDVDLAGLIDTALGPAANILVLDDGQLIQQIRGGKLDIPGRLSLMRLDRIPTRRFGEKVQLDGVQGVVGRADRLVRCKNKFDPLVRYLLGTTWLVESLDVALELGHFRGAGLRFVTRAGELIEADGTLTLGAIQSASGLVSRQSEMRDAKEEIADLRTEQQNVQELSKSLNQELKQLAPQLEAIEEESQQLSQEAARQQALEQNAQVTLDSIEVDGGLLSTTLKDQSAQQSEIEPGISAIGEQVTALQQQIASSARELSDHEQRILAKEEELSLMRGEETEAKVEFARVEQKLESIKAVHEQSSRSQQERLQAVEEAEAELERLANKKADSELKILEHTSELAEAYIVSEAEEQALDGLAESAAELRSRRQQTAKMLESVNRSIDKISQHQETSKLELDRFRESRQNLLQRFEEDYQIPFDALSQAEFIDDSSEREEMDTEASKLRQDIASVGEINMAALAELDELQERYDFLNGQYEDLQAAKESLQRIIQKINQDSRRMFSETLEIIRQNFQKLYRKSFGGGSADIVLEEGEDVLECGIDIIATPPGKTALSNSLLSGGEKALTAVALLLAIFQHRPSPFCVLDEVDAPFDEANIGRFVSVLHEFLDWTKFIIVTHSKKTMTASTTLYGVTMQESGVSKQVAVKFEDVNEKGEIINDKKAA